MLEDTELRFNEYFHQNFIFTQRHAIIDNGESGELIFLLILLHVEFKSFSRLSSESMTIPNKVSAVLEVIVVALINTT